MRLVHRLHFNNLRGDIYGDMVAAVVALPLALAFGIASGLGAIAGLYGAIFVEFFCHALWRHPRSSFRSYQPHDRSMVDYHAHGSHHRRGKDLCQPDLCERHGGF